jgi:hypothetical protein
MLGQGATQISGTFTPRGNYSVDGNLFLMPLTTTQCSVAPKQSDKVEVSGVAMLDGRLQVTMTGRFTREGPARYTLLQARGGLMGVFSFVSIRWVTNQGLSARVTYDPNHVYLELAFEPGEFPPPLDTQRPDKITPTPANVSQAGRAQKSSSTAHMVLHPTVAGLTFAERVAYQYVIEEVYWRHRLWPKDNPDPKPSLDAVVSQREIEKKVEAYLGKSQLVADQRGSPITGSDIQAEMERMATHTRDPNRLRELFAALGNDPLVVAECLARPIVAERLASELNVGTNGRDGSPSHLLSLVNDSARSATAPYQFSYKLPEISVPLGCVDDTWTATAVANAPDAREFYTVVWTGSEMVVWGGFNTSPPYRLNSGGRYDPVTDSWISTSLVNAPSPRDYHSAVWTGSEVIVWGGEPILNTGGKYNPTTDSWIPTSTSNAPAARAAHTAVWAGDEMIVWGGRDQMGWFNTGARYGPNTDSWTATSTINAPERRWYHTALWTGSEMIVWGGTNGTIYLNTGGRYNPSADSWTATGLVNAPLGRVAHTAAWTATEMIVWGGADSTFNDTNTGGRYDPTSDSWTATSTADAPSARDQHTAVWTGSEMIIWGGIFCYPCMDFSNGGRLNPGTGGWIATSTTNAPFAREDHTAVWTGSEMIIWGGYNYTHNLFFNTGGRYCAQSGATPTPTATATPTTTPSSTATPTPTATSTPRPTPTPRSTPPARPRPTPAPRP